MLIFLTSKLSFFVYNKDLQALQEHLLKYTKLPHVVFSSSMSALQLTHSSVSFNEDEKHCKTLLL